MSRFIIIIAGNWETIPDELLDRLFEAGCDDALVCLRGKTLYIEFIRANLALREAVISAVRDVHKAGLKIACVQKDPL